MKPASSFSPRYSCPARVHQPGRSLREPGSVPRTSRISPEPSLSISFLVRNRGIGQLRPFASRVRVGVIPSGTFLKSSLMFSSLEKILVFDFLKKTGNGGIFEMVPLDAAAVLRGSCMYCKLLQKKW